MCQGRFGDKKMSDERRYLCERCGGTGQQLAGCWDGASEVVVTPAFHKECEDGTVIDVPEQRCVVSCGDSGQCADLSGDVNDDYSW